MTVIPVEQRAGRYNQSFQNYKSQIITIASTKRKTRKTSTMQTTVYNVDNSTLSNTNATIPRVISCSLKW